jgi:hypothetical protein
VPRRSPGALHPPDRVRSVGAGRLRAACGAIFVLLVSWNAPTLNCKGGALLSPIDHYELKIFEARIVGMSGANPIYLRSTSRTTTGTSVDIDPPVGGVVAWDGMWSTSWTIQNPQVISVSRAGTRSDQPCQ